jgi:hypothetical protein
MKVYLKRYAEFIGVTYLSGVTTYVAQNGLDISRAGLVALAGAGLGAVYGLLAKHVGDKDKPTISE